MKRLDEKLADIRENPSSSSAFIIADAKDADMAYGVTAPGAVSGGKGWKTRDDYLAQIRAVVEQDIVDIMLLSASNLQRLAIDERLFQGSTITPAARANDTSDIWMVRGGNYRQQPSRPFRSATIDHIKYGRLADDHSQPVDGADLGLYSVTFNNDLQADHRTLEAFACFREEAEAKRLRYMLEVFPPNVDTGIASAEIGAFLNDHIVRCLAGVTETARPVLLKIPYCGPAAVEELVSHDPSLVVGVLGGGAGTTRDAFQLLASAQQHGARAALFGRKINLAEHPLAMIELLRAIADGEFGPDEAVRAYHDRLNSAGLKPQRSLDDDLQITAPELLD